MKNIFLAFLCLLTLNIAAQTITIDPALQQQYLPKAIKGLNIGMTITALKAAHPNASIPTDGILGYYEEHFTTGDITEITYQTAGDDSAVYEFIIEYKSTEKAIAIAKQLYKTPNAVEKGFPLSWKIKLNDGLVLKCWIFKNKICIGDNRQFDY
jgi:hypothetical protein